MRAPSKVTVPERGRSAPAIDLNSVDLPAPLAPATQHDLALGDLDA